MDTIPAMNLQHVLRRERARHGGELDLDDVAAERRERVRVRGPPKCRGLALEHAQLVDLEDGGSSAAVRQVGGGRMKTVAI